MINFHIVVYVDLSSFLKTVMKILLENKPPLRLPLYISPITDGLFERENYLMFSSALGEMREIVKTLTD